MLIVKTNQSMPNGPKSYILLQLGLCALCRLHWIRRARQYPIRDIVKEDLLVRTRLIVHCSCQS